MVAGAEAEREVHRLMLAHDVALHRTDDRAVLDRLELAEVEPEVEVERRGGRLLGGGVHRDAVSGAELEVDGGRDLQRLGAVPARGVGAPAVRGEERQATLEVRAAAAVIEGILRDDGQLVEPAHPSMSAP